MISQGRRVLVSGAGVAGPILAYWLRRFGFRPTVVERSREMRLGGGGHAVDLFGPALQVMDWMGTGAAVRAARTRTETVSFVRPGRSPIEVPAEGLWEGISDQHVEIMRGDLARITYEASREDVEYVLDDSISGLDDHGSGVEVTYERAAPATYDLVVGADGLHSITRRLAFGEETRFLNFLGGYLAVFSVPNYLELDRQMLAFAAPDRIAAVYPADGGTQLRVLFLFRTHGPLDYDHNDPAAQRRVVHGLYADLGREIPRLLAELPQTGDLYLDSISQIRMQSWSKGRVTLVGDAGYSPGPAVGGGTSLAVIGAYTLTGKSPEVT